MTIIILTKILAYIEDAMVFGYLVWWFFKKVEVGDPRTVLTLQSLPKSVQ